MTKEALKKLETVIKNLQTDKAEILNFWKQLSPYLTLSYKTWEIYSEQTSQPVPDYSKVFDSTADEASLLMANGIQGYSCGANSAWFTIAFEDKKLQSNTSLSGQLIDSEEHIYKMFAKSSFYDAVLMMIQLVVNFGTGVIWMEEDISRKQPSYRVLHPKDCFIMQNNAGEIDTLFRTFWLTKEQAVDYFGDNKLSEQIKNCENPTTKFQFWNYTAPRSQFDFKKEVRGKKNYISVYWENGEEKAVKECEYNVKPFAVWRYFRDLDNGVWGFGSPGIRKLSDIRQVNAMCKDRAILSQRIADPPIKKTRGLKIDITPHGQTEVSAGQDYAFVGMGANNLAWTQEIIQDLRKSIRSAYFADYFLILSSTVEQRKTATEAQGLQEEKSVIMASFFNRMGSEFFEPVIEWTYQNELSHGRLPELLKAMQENNISNADFKIDFVSQLSSMQKVAIALRPIQAYAKEVFGLAQAYPQALQKLNVFEYLDAFADVNGTNKKVVVNTTIANKEYQKQIQAQAQLMQQQNKINQAEQESNTLKNLAEVENGSERQ